MTPLLSAGVVVVRRTLAGWRFLMLRAYRNWDFAKGLVEPGEAPLAAAVREVEEETLIRDLLFEWGETYFETAPYGRNMDRAGARVGGASHRRPARVMDVLSLDGILG